MTHEHFNKVFHGKEGEKKLQEMLNERKEGKSTTYLGEKFGVDHSTISYWCKKMGVKASQNFIRLPQPVEKVFFTQPEIVEIINKELPKEPPKEEEINQGKTYQEYCEIENIKKAERFKNKKLVLGC